MQTEGTLPQYMQIMNAGYTVTRYCSVRCLEETAPECQCKGKMRCSTSHDQPPWDSIPLLSLQYRAMDLPWQTKPKCTNGLLVCTKKLFPLAGIAGSASSGTTKLIMYEIPHLTVQPVLHTDCRQKGVTACIDLHPQGKHEDS